MVKTTNVPAPSTIPTTGTVIAPYPGSPIHKKAKRIVHRLRSLRTGPKQPLRIANQHQPHHHEVDQNHQWDGDDRADVKQRHEYRHRRNRRRAPREQATVHLSLLAFYLLETHLESFRFAFAAHQPSAVRTFGSAPAERQRFEAPWTRLSHLWSIRTAGENILISPRSPQNVRYCISDVYTTEDHPCSALDLVGGGEPPNRQADCGASQIRVDAHRIENV